MIKMNNSNKSVNVTNVDDLPDIDDMDNTSDLDMYNEGVQRHIRVPHVAPPTSGMLMQKQFHQQTPPPVVQEQFTPEQPKYNPPASYNIPEYTGYGQQGGYIQEPNCIMIAEHVQSCPICSQLYNSNVNKLYLMLLAIVSIICILLIKKILDDK